MSKKQREKADVVPHPDPEKDGITHINTHNQSKTELGRMLAHFCHMPFRHPYYGPFHTMEGFWHYYLGGCKDDAYRTLNGHRCKVRAKNGVADGTYHKVKVPNLQEVILAANYAKIDQNDVLKEALITSTLPFEHYYLHGPGNVVIRPRGAEWLIPSFSQLRDMFINGTEPDPIDYSKHGTE